MKIVCHVTVGLFDLVYGIIDSLLEIVMVCSSVSGERRPPFHFINFDLILSRYFFLSQKYELHGLCQR